jgi:hypothetical protein
LSQEFVKNMLLLIGVAVGLGLLIALFVFMGGSRSPKRYRPGRPFTFSPVWFLSAPEQQSRAGLTTGKSLALTGPTGAARLVRPAETGGASDRW